MRRLAINSGGLGGAIVADATNISLCDSGWYWLMLPCWTRSRDAWSQLAAANAAMAIPSSVITAPPVPDFGTSTQPMPVSVEDAAAAQQVASDQAILAQQQAVADFASTLPDNPVPAAPCSILNVPCWAVYALAGVAAFALIAYGGGSPGRYGR